MGLPRSVGRLCSQAFLAQGASEAENLNLKRSHGGSGAPQKFNANWPHQEAAWTIACMRQAIQSPSLPSVVCVLKHSLHKGLARSSWEFEPEEKPLWIRSPSKIQRLLTPSRSGLNNCCVHATSHSKSFITVERIVDGDVFEMAMLFPCFGEWNQHLPRTLRRRLKAVARFASPLCNPVLLAWSRYYCSLKFHLM